VRLAVVALTVDLVDAVAGEDVVVGIEEAPIYAVALEHISAESAGVAPADFVLDAVVDVAVQAAVHTGEGTEVALAGQAVVYLASQQPLADCISEDSACMHSSAVAVEEVARLAYALDAVVASGESWAGVCERENQDVICCEEAEAKARDVEMRRWAWEVRPSPCG